ncbi:hypothetical protein [Robiginitalea sp. SC105]|uniref:hypothetical protein n=1 Tax=Robiginitalea sp. SC105 TaxID=2762332 RepID=UPI00163B3F7B|nr:hypothetical protein [Robiginitalea sp. SC105]MBC2837700.1 hypothetical protein [Robiginitalea sp. SC105]
MSYRTFLNFLLPLGTCLLLAACGGGDSGGGEPEPEPVPSPSAATLVFPENDSECTEGELLNENRSRVLFQWTASAGTDSYQVNLKNLNTGGTTISNSSENQIEIVLLRGVPYEWFVISRATGTPETASSPVWRFYNAGPGIENYAPFPAQAVSPARGINLAATPSVTLEWSASDIDGDIASYSVYFGTDPEPPLLEEGLTEPTLEVAVSSGQTYYWRVETIDSAGNVTVSELFEFRVE